MRICCWIAALLGGMSFQAGLQAADLPVENVILVTLDGLRWQELFGGLDETLLNDKENGTEDPAELNRRFAAATAEERRQLLMPFFWSTVATQGVVIGDADDDSHLYVTNGRNFSYPGYSEILCGFPDQRIDSNAKTNNANVTVLEWLHRRDGFQGRITAYCSWDVFPWIINTTRSGIPVNAGWMPLAENDKAAPELQRLDQLAREIPHYWDGVRYDIFTFAGAEHALRTQKPRVLYVSLGETDDWAHSARYDLYLDAAFRNDDYIRRLWETAQSIPEYRHSTALVITTDHGRGDDRISWRSHGEDVEGSDRIWAAVLSPGIAANTSTTGRFSQAQIAATVARLLGEDYNAAVEQAGQPLPLGWR